MNIGDLNHLYDEAEAVHAPLFAEQRSNLLLVAGNHYNFRGSRFWRRVRETQALTRQQKLRLTKNHLQRITKGMVNDILSYSPGIGIGPQNESEVQDRKSAELNGSVWSYIKHKHKYTGLKRKFVEDFINIGELFCKVFYDYDAGDFLGYEPVINESGEIEHDESGEPVAIPRFSGDLVYERILGFNLLSDPEARSWEECRWVCYRKMLQVKDLKARYKDDPEKSKLIVHTSKQTYKIFDGQNGTYYDSRGLTMVREYYFRPSAEYPKGYYFITTEHGILEEGELPLGKFPILRCGYDDLNTSARAVSIIKQLRPYQAEINRAASKVAEHQITLGDDKIITQSGVSVSAGGTTHGIKHIKVNGPEPKIMQGRTGEQYLPYIDGQIREMYMISGRDEDYEKEPGQMDPYTLLFRSIRHKKKFALYTEKLVDFEKELCEFSLELKREYCSEEELIPVIGRREYVNISEFKNSEKLSYQIIFEEQSEDVETKMGRQLTLNHIMQYAGNTIDQNELGRLVRSMPYVNKEEVFTDLTIDYDNATNDILMLDRGQWAEPNLHDNHNYVVKRLVHRMKQPDFEHLPPEVQQMYYQKKQIHEQEIARQIEAEQAAQAGFIPSGGYLVTVDFYMQKPGEPGKTQRARLPYESIDWLVKRLESQGSTQDALQQHDSQTQGEIAQLMAANPQPGQMAGGM